MKDVNFLHGLNRSQNKAVSRKTMTVDIGYLAQILCAMPRPQNDTPRRSREMTHFCSFRVTHTENTI